MKCHRSSTPLVGAVLLAMLGGCAMLPTADTSPMGVYKAYEAAVNSGDMAAIRAMVADEAGDPPMNRCPPELKGSKCLIDYLRTTVVEQHSKLTTLQAEVKGDTVFAKLEVANDLTRAAGVDRLAGTDKIRVKDGKIIEFAYLRDAQDEQTQKFFRYMMTTMRPGAMPPGGMPGMPPAGMPPRN